MERCSRKCAISLICVLALICTMATSSGLALLAADTAVWRQLPIYGGDVSCLAISTSAVYAGTSGAGVFRSADKGDTWLAVSTGPSSVEGSMYSEIISLATTPGSPGVVYAGTPSALHVSTDDGVMWKRTGLVDTSIYSIAVDPAVSSTLYAGTKKGVFRSDDAGVSWKAASPTATTKSVLSVLAVGGSKPALYAGTDGDGVFRSWDQGATWTAVSSGLANTVIQGLAGDPSNTSTIYAATKKGPFRSDTSGGSWQSISSGVTSSDVKCVVIDSAASVVFVGTTGGVFRSSDRGASWALVTSSLSVACLAADSTGRTVYAGISGEGVRRSEDQGSNWTVCAQGMAATRVEQIVIDPTHDSTLYAATYGTGVERSDDGGDSWLKLSSAIVRYVNAIAVDPRSPETIYSGTTNGVYRSDDRGMSWKKVSTGLKNATVNSLAVNPATSVVYAATNGGVSRSSDRGETWTDALVRPYAYALAIDTMQTQTLYAGFADASGEPGGVYRTDDGGTSWKSVVNGLTKTSVNEIAIDSRTGVVYAAIYSSGVFRTVDKGETWAAASGGLKGMAVYVRSVAIDFSVPGGVVAGTSVGVYTSKDGGEVWTASPSGLPSSEVMTVALSKTSPARLYAGTRSRGAFRLDSALPPGVPGSVSLEKSSSSLVVRWKASSSGTSPVAGYAIYRSTTTGSPAGAPHATVGSSELSWSDTDATRGTTYYYSVAAFDGSAPPRYSERSAEVYGALPLPVTLTLTLTLRVGSVTMMVAGSGGTRTTVTLDAAPVIGAGNRTLVPVRAVAEAMGGSVGWDPATRTATVTVGANSLQLTLGRSTARFNGANTPIDADPKVVPLIVNGRTMLPLRFVVESLGATVAYEQISKTITITYVKP
jgi:photosystem II stability/assembly factor-like uncharacterized protein